MRFVIAFMLLTTPAMAQQQQVASPSQLAVEIDNAVGTLSRQAEYYKAQAEKAQQQIADLQKQLDALKPKDEPKK